MQRQHSCLLVVLLGLLCTLSSGHPLYSCQGCFDWCLRRHELSMSGMAAECLACNAGGTHFGSTVNAQGCYDAPPPGSTARRICYCKTVSGGGKLFDAMQWQYWKNGANNPDPNAPADHYFGETELIDGPQVTPGVCTHSSNLNSFVRGCTPPPTLRPPTNRPTTRSPTRRPTSRAPTTRRPTKRPTSRAPTTRPPTGPPTTETPTTSGAPTTRSPTTMAPTDAPTTVSPTTSSPTVFDACTADGGVIATHDSTTICGADGVSDPVTFHLIAATSETNTFVWLYVDENGDIVAVHTHRGNGMTTFDVETGALGKYAVFHFAYTGVLLIGEGDNLGQKRISTGCSHMSNRIILQLVHCTAEPTVSPTHSPSVTPTQAPSSTPTVSPTAAPSVTPTTAVPSVTPTSAPSLTPTSAPTVSPTTTAPSVSPSNAPSASPTVIPSSAPSVAPTLSPSRAPTVSPTPNPTTLSPTTFAPTTDAPTTDSEGEIVGSPTTDAPTTLSPTTLAPTTDSPTDSPTTSIADPLATTSTSPTLAPTVEDGAKATCDAQGGCLTDLAEQNAVIDIVDLAELLAGWGKYENPGVCGDFNDDTEVNIVDLADLLASWGPCSAVEMAGKQHTSI